jgi:hypothetical protein
MKKMDMTQHSSTSATTPKGDVSCPSDQLAELSASALSDSEREQTTLLELKDEDLEAVAGGFQSRARRTGSFQRTNGKRNGRRRGG